MTRLSWSSRISASFADLSIAHSETGVGQWRISIVDGCDLAAEVRLQDAWLRFDSEVVNRLADSSARSYLKINAGLRGMAKFVFPLGAEGISLRAELPLEEDMDLGARLRQSIEGLRQGLLVELGNRSHSTQQEETANVVKATLAESRWNFRERENHSFAVELETQRGYWQATVEHVSGGGVRCLSEIVTDESPEATCQDAVAILLLRTAAAVRMCRGCGHENTVGFEVSFDTPPAVSELNHALGSLSLAIGMAADEAKLLSNGKGLAIQYLAMQKNPNVKKETKEK